MKKLLTITAVTLISTSAIALESGVYSSKSSPDDVITVKGKEITLVTSRQVGGPGGISNDELVPYPTVCRYKRFAKITEETISDISFDIKYIYVVKSAENTEHCSKWVEEYKGILSLSGANFSYF